MEQESHEILTHIPEDSPKTNSKELIPQTIKLTDGLSRQHTKGEEINTPDNIDNQTNITAVQPNGNELESVPPIPIETNSQLAIETNKIYSALSQFSPPPLPERKESVNISENDDSLDSKQNETKILDNEGPNLPPRRSVPILPSRNKQQNRDPNKSNGEINNIESERSLIADDMLIFRLNETINELKLSDKYKPHGILPHNEELTDNGETEESNIWKQLIKDPENTINERYETIEKLIISSNSIPVQLRNEVWESVTFMKSHNWNTIYELLVSKDSSFDEEQIKIDIEKIFPENEEQKDIVFNVVKTYLSFDPEVEYSESILSVISIFTKQYNNDKIKIFGLFCILMKYYRLREFFLNNEFNDMNKILFKFDRLLQEHDIDLYNHLLQQGIKSRMFVIDWIKSIFQKIGFSSSEQIIFIDLIFFYGFDILLSISCQILLFNKRKVMSMEYEELLVTLKDGNNLLPIDDKTSSDNTSDDIKIEARVLSFNELIKKSASPAMIRPNLLKLFSQEYDEIYSGDKAMRDEFQKMQTENKELQKEVKKLEHDYTLLNREHVTIANELLQSQLKINSILSENSRLKIEVLEAKRKLEQQIRENKGSNNKPIPSDLQKNLDDTLKKNANVMQKNLIYQDKINELENLVTELTNANEKGIYLSHLFSNDNPLSRTPLIDSTWTGFKKVFQ